MYRIASLFLILLLALSSPDPAAAEHFADPQLNDVLQFIETANTGTIITARIHENHTNLTFGHIPTVAQYDPNTNTITFDEGMRSQPLEVLAFILVHESMHVLDPWENLGEECYRAEYFADLSAVLWWWDKYRDGGHPNPAANQFISYFNYLLSLYVSDRQDGGRRLRNQLRVVYAPTCEPTGAAPTPTPTPTPQSTPRPTPMPIAAGSTLDDVEHMITHYRAFAQRAIGEAYGINQSGVQASMIYDLMEWAVHAMPYVYLMFTWSEYPSEEYPNTREFARSYVRNSRHYARIAYRWLESDPCTWPQEAQEFMVAHAIDYPGHIRGMVEAMLTIPSLAIHYWNGARSTAEWDYFNDAEAYLDQFRCSS